MCSFKAHGHCTLEVFGSKEGEKTRGRGQHLSLCHIEFEGSWMAVAGGYFKNGCTTGEVMEHGTPWGEVTTLSWEVNTTSGIYTYLMRNAKKERKNCRQWWGSRNVKGGRNIMLGLNLIWSQGRTDSGIWMHKVDRCSKWGLKWFWSRRGICNYTTFLANSVSTGWSKSCRVGCWLAKGKEILLPS